ncbi:hypothetical protein MRB53_007665 [Persea americana]|uniref:Uncharacterized protein n=1 Tax=Persea americana TaxID=3435 RepID=A0ACC2ML74_PERAE|nr:hypothetical protein MRB53_007665 [Persea americana]
MIASYLFVLSYVGVGELVCSEAIDERDKVQRIDFCANRSPEKAAYTPPSSQDDTGRDCQSSPVTREETAGRCSVHDYVSETKPVEGRRRSPEPS